ncbi:MAG TPA: hypothetical protein VNB06_22370, partial [Thermoanaerobaculia bacterium]|nr:hypothetical protein [Thermoanaerobaculia bacterium]
AGTLESEGTHELTLGKLFEQYLGEVTPQKSAAVQKFDQAAAERIKKSLGSGREVSKLSRREWDQFIRERQSGRYTGRRVGPRTVARDLKFLLAVLNWATVSGDGRGDFLLDRNPLRGLPLPKEKSPRRPAMTVELREGLMKHSPNWQFELALLLERETRRRNASIRRLRWSDIDFERETARWRAEFDKAGRESVTPLTNEALTALKKLRRVGFHSEKRAGVRDPRFRALPPAIQEAWAGTSYQVLKDVYDDVTAEDIREAIQQQERALGSR